MLLLAATTDRLTDNDIAFARLPEPPPPGAALVIDQRLVHEQMWHLVSGSEAPPETASCVRVPLWACNVDASTGTATFYATTHSRRATTVLAAFYRTQRPATPDGLAAWAQAVAMERAQVNFPVPRPGQRPANDGAEAETRVTLTSAANPVAIARILRDRLPTTGTRPIDDTIYRRILHSEIYLPVDHHQREYAALTQRPDGSWWAKTKILRDERLCKTVRPATDHRHAIDLVSSVFGQRALHHSGDLHRSTWDLLSPTNQDGHWSTITVDATTLAPHPGHLQQVEIEYGACFTATPITATFDDIEKVVASTADDISTLLTANGIAHQRCGTNKLQHFLGKERADDNV
jgi:hypothetical protein